jgi:hypothetical protein
MRAVFKVGSIPVVLAAALTACNSNPADAPAGPDTAKAQTTSTATSTASPHGPTGDNPHLAAPPPKKATDVHWKAPEAWALSDHPSPMRLATYKVPKADGDSDDGELSITQVGGDVASNVERWKGQFEGGPPAKVTDRAVGDFKVTVVEAEGSFKGMSMPAAGPTEPKKDWALLGAVVEWPGHGDAYFFKLTGPKKTIDAAKPGFDELLGSLAHD